MSHAKIGVMGLGTMGANLALNFQNKGHSVAAYDRSPDHREAFKLDHDLEDMIYAESLEDFCASLATPRTILLMVTAGDPVDWCIDELLPFLDLGDRIIDGGNSFFKDTQRRSTDVEEKGFHYYGVGVSGGAEGARTGPSMMIGGSREAWPHIADMLQSIAAKAPDGTPCCQWVGGDGAGHFVKMVHNGIEYGDMQLIAESYAIMRHVLGIEPAAQAAIFREWNQGELDSYLIEITATVLEMTDPDTDQPMVDVILDAAGQKGTGKWVSQVALDVGGPIATITEAVFARFVSAFKEDRVEASQVLHGPETTFSGNREEVLEELRQALYVSKICSYAQGFQLMSLASDENGWDLRMDSIALLWRAGCIIRARFLDSIHDGFKDVTTPTNLLLSDAFKEIVSNYQPAWRSTVQLAVAHGVPIPSMMASLAYFDSFRSETISANVIQAQRDYFGAHGFERTDRPRGETFHLPSS